MLFRSESDGCAERKTEGSTDDDTGHVLHLHELSSQRHEPTVQGLHRSTGEDAVEVGIMVRRRSRLGQGGFAEPIARPRKDGVGVPGRGAFRFVVEGVRDRRSWHTIAPHRGFYKEYGTMKVATPRSVLARVGSSILLASAVAAVGFALSATPHAQSAGEHWVGTWATSEVARPQTPPAPVQEIGRAHV